MTAVATTFSGAFLSRNRRKARRFDPTEPSRFALAAPEPRAEDRFRELLADGALLALHDDELGGYVGLLEPVAGAEYLERIDLLEREREGYREQANDARQELQNLGDAYAAMVRALAALAETARSEKENAERAEMGMNITDGATWQDLRYACEEVDSALPALRDVVDSLADVDGGDD